LVLDTLRDTLSHLGLQRGNGRRRFELEDTGFNEVPKKYRKFYRKRTSRTDPRSRASVR
jgi:hypothetical protein